jgi:hypothetical protein
MLPLASVATRSRSAVRATIFGAVAEGVHDRHPEALWILLVRP